VTDDLGGFESLRPLFLNDVVADVARGGGQAVLVKDRPDVLRRMIEVASEFDFLVAGGGDFRDGALEVGFHGVANGVELDADTVDVMAVSAAQDGREAARVAAMEVPIKVRRFMGAFYYFPEKRAWGFVRMRDSTLFFGGRWRGARQPFSFFHN